MFLRVRFILTDKTEGFLLPGSVDGSTKEPRALYQHRQDPYRVPLFGELEDFLTTSILFHRYKSSILRKDLHTTAIRVASYDKTYTTAIRVASYDKTYAQPS